MLKVLFLTMTVSCAAYGTTYVVFRYDDFSGDKPGVRETDRERQSIWTAEQAADRMFEQYKLPYVIAAIPKYRGTPLSDDAGKVQFLVRVLGQKRAELAQHGFIHKNYAPPGYAAGEFRNRDYQDQFSDLQEGRDILRRTLGLSAITTFVPPYDGWSHETADILKKLDFRVLSADCRYYYTSADGLVVIPFTVEIGDMEALLAGGTMPEGVVVILYHPDNLVVLSGMENNYYGLEKFERILQKVSAISNIKTVTFDTLIQECNNLTIERYRGAYALDAQQSFWQKLPLFNFGPDDGSPKSYLETATYLHYVKRWRALTAAFIGGLFLLGAAVQYFFISRLPCVWRFRINAVATLVFCLCAAHEIRILHKGYHISGAGAIPGIFTASFAAVFLLGFIKRRVMHSTNLMCKVKGV
jgi:hypothetical protein